MPFEKGQSGNPGGRPKENQEVRDLAREHTVEAIQRLVVWMNSDNPKASVSACQAILNRGWGTPTSTVELTGKDGGPIETIAKTELDQAREVAFLLARGANRTETQH